MGNLYGTVYVFQSPHICSHTLFRMCSCISICIHVHLTVPMVAQPPMHCYMQTWIPLCGSVCVSQSLDHWSHTLFRMCTCISTCIHVHLTYHVCFTFLNSDMETWVPLYGSVCVLQSACFGPTPWLKCVHASVHVLCEPEFRILIHLLCIVIWKYGLPGVAQCVCSSQSTFVPTPCLECVHASVHVFMSTQLPM